MFRVARPYLNLLVNPKVLFRFSGKNITLCILKGKMPFKMHKIIFSRKKIKWKIICVPTLPKIFRPVTQNSYFFIWPYSFLNPISSTNKEADDIFKFCCFFKNNKYCLNTAWCFMWIVCQEMIHNFTWNVMPDLFWKLRKMSHNLSSSAVVIDTLRAD